MKLEKFKEKDRKKQGIIVFTIVCIFLIIGVFLYRTFALYEVSDTKNIIEGTYTGIGAISFTYYIDDTLVKEVPVKTSGKVFDKKSSYCTNEASIRWNYEDWAPVVGNLGSNKIKCHVKFKTEYSESILNGADPVLESPLIPVKISDTGVVTRANTNEEWYKYEDKIWANAVILNDESTESNYQAGDVIPENAIESYFVWIPRYRYKIFNDGNYTTLTTVENKVQTIEVVFENKDTPVSSGTSTGSWLTHPAFTSFDSNGMWVGKFETGKISGSDNVRNGEAIQIKPNVYSWRDIQPANAFYTTYDYKRNLDSHMMKNTEWGAVAYLQHSVYGSQASVRNNNNSSFLSGYAAVTEPTCGYTATNEACNKYESAAAGVDGTHTINYLNPNSIVASTTGNYSGVYDMSGGAWEYVMGVMVDQSGNPTSGRNSTQHSGFNGTLGCPTCDGDTSGITGITNGLNFPVAKYYDKYVYAGTNQQYNRRLLGDATGEMGSFNTVTYAASNGTSQIRSIGSWYADYAWFVYSTNPWFIRGYLYNNGSDAGVFAFRHDNGSALSSVSFRVVLMP